MPPLSGLEKFGVLLTRGYGLAASPPGYNLPPLCGFAVF
jgi:hypothetical protein